jgi:hypothetical protein
MPELYPVAGELSSSLARVGSIRNTAAFGTSSPVTAPMNPNV